MERQNRHLVDLSHTSKPVYASRKAKWRKPSTAPGQLSLDLAGDGQGDLIQGEVVAAEAARSAAAGGEHRTAAAAGGDGLLFQSNGHCCDETDGEDIGSVYRLWPCHCRRWFCRGCGPRLGWQLFQKLKRRLDEFQDVFGVTLTLDGALFKSPEHGWSYVMEKRLLPRLVKDIRARGHLHTKAYFWSVEFQEDTEQAHWHMLLDATRIPYGLLVEIWSRFRPTFAPELAEPITAENYKGRAPAFGSVFFSPPLNRGKAAWYATKYLCKYPKQGYPDWVMDRKGRMPRYGHSHRFFPRKNDHEPDCFCDVCKGEAEPPPLVKQERKPKNENRPPRRESKATIRERVEQCGLSCSIVRVRQIRKQNGLVIDGPAKYDGKLELPIAEACDHVGVDPAAYREMSLYGEQVTELEELSGQRPRSKGAA